MLIIYIALNIVCPAAFLIELHLIFFTTNENLNKREFDIFIGRNKMDIKACPKCGSKDVRMAGIGEGTIFGLTSWDMVCEKCNYIGMPIIFNSEKDYEAFLKELENEQKPD